LSQKRQTFLALKRWQRLDASLFRAFEGKKKIKKNVVCRFLVGHNKTAQLAIAERLRW